MCGYIIFCWEGVKNVAEWIGEGTTVTGNDEKAYEKRARELYAKKEAGNLTYNDQVDMNKIEATTLSDVKNILKGLRK